MLDTFMNTDCNTPPTVSVMIATYNSAGLLRRTLDAIVKQEYPSEQLEIVIVDGGSRDETLTIATEYGCTIIKNPKTEPVHAKYLGFANAKGRYFVTIDHDEVLVNPCSISKRVLALHQNPQCIAALSSGYVCPPEYGGLSEYISEYGDPFSFFMYHFSKGAVVFEKQMKRYYKTVTETTDYFVSDFSGSMKEPIFELICAGTMVDRERILALLGPTVDERQLVQLWYLLRQKGISSMVVSKEDPIWHYSSDTVAKYLPKLKWRICNNVHFSEKGEFGFNGRQAYQMSLRFRKYLFIPYALTGVIPLAEGARLAISRRNVDFLLHPLFAFYVAMQILIQYALKCMHISPAFRSYDGKSKIER